MKNSIKLFFKRNSKKLAVGALAALIAATALTGCSSSSSGVSIAVPNDTTNEARALLLLEHNGYIKLKDGAGITATIKDIVENPYNITFKEIEAAQLPNTLKDQDYAVINSNYAIQANLNPVKDSLLIEDSSSQYSNIVAVKEGSENSDKTKALVAALESKDVADYISQTYSGAVVSVVENPGDGYDSSVNYDALGGQTITVAASPTPHAEILKVAKEILAKKNVTLDIKEFTDYVQPNNVVDSGEVDANYFQHKPYLDDFNAQNKTHVVSAAAIHVEPLGLYGGKQSSLDAIKAAK
ncbi:MAG: MetQ/NlpA family ABC transporter substrate-binding protein [Clostridia bacterium]|nr:MetQ/NlpA family ABC transporter substrate-binding protein [Clostridia bacterium]